MSLRFVHAADLHLDSPFLGLAGSAPESVARTLRDATFAAYDAIIDLCIRERVDALLVAGDIYDGADRSLRAHKLHFDKLYFSELQAPAAELLRLYGPVLAAQSLQEVVLHQLRPQDLALADGLGLQPGDITVTEDGLVIGFVAKTL